ncbi:hypothetical protein BJ322DRAFT_1112889 [Thelephora terrestris]|uniref:Uncharacterized protein n=1 Tax=Thelephora terrestris TaxID=56493 RepID=A0A9P6L2S5_9AGAM|nr:hypothetical protein BJ322DRAFT_1112889 [Thelephora terrestris]
MNGTRVPGKETLKCEECKRRGVECGGVWKFHSQHGIYILQCKTCRLKKRACPFRRFEDNDKPQATSAGRGRRGKKREREDSPISISDSSESDGPSSRPEKKPKVESKSEKDWDKLEQTLLLARKRRVVIQTRAEIEMAKVDTIIEEAERDVKMKPKD